MQNNPRKSGRIFDKIVTGPKAKHPAVITGGAGFLGSHLAERLIGMGQTVVCVDNFSTGRMENIQHLLPSGKILVRHHDVRKPFNWNASAVFSFASPASPPVYQLDPVRTLMTNIQGVRNCLELATRCDAPVIQASTSEVYGDPLISPQRENYLGNVNTTGPRACYDEGKRCAETLMFDYVRMYDTSIKVGRIFNTYGPRMRADDGRVVSNFIVQALTNQPITVYGSGQQTRSFCYVDDLIEGFIRLWQSPPEFRGPVNLGNPIEFEVRELAELVIELTNSRSKIVHLPAVIDDPKQRRPDISLAKAELDWEPRVGLKDGLNRTIAYFDAQLGKMAVAGEEAEHG